MSDFVAPAYHDRSLGDVLPAVATALSVDAALPATGLSLPPAPAYVVLLVDGLGAEQLERARDEAPYLSSLLAGQPPLTAGVPSTTATSLTSFGTALTPAVHGMLGFTTRIPGTDDLLNALQWSSKVDPLTWQPHPTAFSRLAAAGVHTTVVNKREFAKSGLTAASSRGAEFVGADRFGERAVAAVAASAHSPSLTYLYDGDLDWTGHRYGVASAQWQQQLSMVDAAAQQLREALPHTVRLLVVADHGMVDSPVAARVDVDQHDALRDGVVLLGGEARFRHVYCQTGAVADVHSAWSTVLGDRAVVLTRDEALAAGWFGELDPAVRPRIGDVVAACRDDVAIVSSVAFPYEASMIGMHGSLTSAEMLIPLLVA